MALAQRHKAWRAANSRKAGRLAITLGAASDLQFRSDSLELVREDERLLMYAPYGQIGAADLTVECSDGNQIDLEVQVRELVWRRLADWDPTDGSGPPGREYGAAFFHQGNMMLYGGFHYQPRQFTPANDLWMFDGQTHGWTELNSEDGPLVPGARVAPGRDAGEYLLYGGGTISEDGSLRTVPALNVLDMTDPSAAHPEFGPAPYGSVSPASYTGSFVYDSFNQRWISACGADTYQNGVHCRVFAYDFDNGWEELEVADGPSPAGRFGFHYAYDEETVRLIIAGGQSDGRTVYGDTWALELGEREPRWVMLDDENEEVRRRNGAYVLDPVGRRLLIWGGTADGRSPIEGLSALSLDREREVWTHLATPDEVLPRASGLAAYDGTEHRVVFGMGNARQVFTDLYELVL